MCVGGGGMRVGVGVCGCGGMWGGGAYFSRPYRSIRCLTLRELCCNTTPLTFRQVNLSSVL